MGFFKIYYDFQGLKEKEWSALQKKFFFVDFEFFLDYSEFALLERISETRFALESILADDREDGKTARAHRCKSGAENIRRLGSFATGVNPREGAQQKTSQKTWSQVT
jgi:hypothetical protein